MVILFGTVDPLDVQKIHLAAKALSDRLLLFFGEKLVPVLPDIPEMIKVQLHLVVEKGSVFRVFQVMEKIIIGGALQVIRKLRKSPGRSQQLRIQAGASPEKLLKSGQIQRNRIGSENMPQAFF